ncbi:MAG: TerC family protein [Firmicutes bacterium]|nr:TerC family protein [Bacillota bacterium]
MEIYSSEFLSTLLLIIGIDLVLAGDNAIVIAMAVRNLPAEQSRKGILYGTAGAVVIRIIATLMFVKLLEIPYLMLVGGIALTWIAYKLLVEDDEQDVEAAGSLREAIKTIVIADAAMGLDNVLAVAGAAHGSYLLVIIGLLISIPIVIWGSTMISGLMNKYPIIIYFGAGILALTAGKMITSEQAYIGFFKANPSLKYLVIGLVIAGVITAGRVTKLRKARKYNIG